jgi:hypothetical protein
MVQLPVWEATEKKRENTPNKHPCPSQPRKNGPCSHMRAGNPNQDCCPAQPPQKNVGATHMHDTPTSGQSLCPADNPGPTVDATDTHRSCQYCCPETDQGMHAACWLRRQPTAQTKKAGNCLQTTVGACRYSGPPSRPPHLSTNTNKLMRVCWMHTKKNGIGEHARQQKQHHNRLCVCDVRTGWSSQLSTKLTAVLTDGLSDS